MENTIKRATAGKDEMWLEKREEERKDEREFCEEISNPIHVL